MKKLTKLTHNGQYSNRLTENFRKLIHEKIGKLDTATSFMYLFRRFGQPTFNNSDEYKILYEYRFRHEDLLITVHASYHEFVYFSLHIPKKRVNKWWKHRRQWWKQLYKKYNDFPFMPYSMLPYQGTEGLTKLQNKKNWHLIDVASEKFFDKKDGKYIEEQWKTGKPDAKVFEMLRPFGEKLCKDFRKKLTKEELDILKKHTPELKDITGLEQQCMVIVSELKRGFYVRDVAINILGYEGKENIITEYELETT